MVWSSSHAGDAVYCGDRGNQRVGNRGSELAFEHSTVTAELRSDSGNLKHPRVASDDGGTADLHAAKVARRSMLDNDQAAHSTKCRAMQVRPPGGIQRGIVRTIMFHRTGRS